jgi:hypothetical protein
LSSEKIRRRFFFIFSCGTKQNPSKRSWQAILASDPGKRSWQAIPASDPGKRFWQAILASSGFF